MSIGQRKGKIRPHKKSLSGPGQQFLFFPLALPGLYFTISAIG